MPDIATLQINDVRFFMIHDRNTLRDTPAADVVISGHSHKPLIEQTGTTLFLNPGSAGPRRFKLPTTIAKIRISKSRAKAEVISLL
jgi:putative phosphoesterase